VFCIYLRTNSDLCHLQHKLVGFYNRDEKCLQRGTDWVFKYCSLRFVFKGLIKKPNQVLNLGSEAFLVPSENISRHTIEHILFNTGNFSSNITYLSVLAKKVGGSPIYIP
jgi:hypothetical protein